MAQIEEQMDLDDSDLDSDPPTRRTTRSALADVSYRTGPDHTPITNMILFNGRFPTPSPSPDELVIQQRGRRSRVPATWSPPDGSKQSRTPVKVPQSPSNNHAKSTLVLRSTPRKRLLLGDALESPDKTPRKASTPLKRLRSERLAANLPPGSLPTALKGLSHAQLVEMLVTLMQNHAELEQEVLEHMPAPDLRPLEDQLSNLKKNIYKSLPTSRLTSKYDSPAYNRASTHVLNFKKAVVDNGRQLLESEQWSSVVEYVILAWSYVRATPKWENTTHNTPRRQCFKALASQCMTALRKGTFTRIECRQIAEKIEGFQSDSEDIASVLKQLTVMSSSNNSTPTKT